jgi:hypothetical protein
LQIYAQVGRGRRRGCGRFGMVARELGPRGLSDEAANAKREEREMRVLNFGHSLTWEQRQQIQELTGQKIQEVVDAQQCFDDGASFVEQAQRLVDAVGFTGQQWQTEAFVVNLPTHSVIAALVLAEIHGRAGYFPTVLRLRPVEGATPVRFEVAEVINLQQVRNRARDQR